MSGVLVEVVLVEPFVRLRVGFWTWGGVGRHSDAVADHELGQLSAVDKAYVLIAGGDGPGGAARALAEFGGGDEDSHGGSVRVEAAGEAPDLGFSDLAGPAFCLDVQPVEAEGVLVDDSVYASVSAASGVSSVSVAHLLQEVEDGVLEVVRGGVGEGVEDIGF